MVRKRIITPNAQADIEEITDFIFADNPAKAADYFSAASKTFFEMPENLTPTRADDRLPICIRKFPVQEKGFESYFLYIAMLDDVIALVAAFRPGLPDGIKIRRAQLGIREIGKPNE